MNDRITIWRREMHPMGDDPVYSIVVPFYNEAPQLETVATHIRTEMEALGESFELVFIDDGSADGTWSGLQMLAADYPEVRAFKLSRNFGKEAALAAGLDAARGQAVITMDGDLQHPPHLIPQMIQSWRRGEGDVIEAVKVHHDRGSAVARYGASLFYALQKRLAGVDLNGASDFKLLDRKVVDAWKRIRERKLFFRGISHWLGFERVQIPFTVEERVGGATKWSFWQLFKLALTGITSYTSLPLQATTLIGLAFLILAAPLGLHTLYMKVSGQAVSGFTTVILLLLITGSFILISLGVIGAYLAQIYEEVKERPRYLVSRETSCEHEEEVHARPGYSHC